MGDVVLKRLQVGTEGAFTSGAAFVPSNTISVYANGGAPVAATRRVAVEDSTEFGYQELTWEAPEEARGTYNALYQHVLQMRMAKGKFAALLYPDDVVWYLRGAVSGAPIVTTLPTTPQGVLSAQTVTASPLSLSGITQPNAQADLAVAKILELTLTAGSTNTTAISFTISGTDQNGNNLTETVAFPSGLQTLSQVGGGAGATSCTLYTVNYFATITQITATSTITGDSLRVRGLNAFLWTFTPDMSTSTLVSQTGEYFDGSTSWQLPGLVLPKFDFNIDVGKSVKISGDGLARDMASISNLTSISDQVLPATSSYAARYYSDPIGTTPGTTQVNTRLLQATLGIENQLTLGKAADGTPLPNFVARKRYKTKGELTLLFQNGLSGSEDPADFAAFARQYASRTIMVALPAVAYLPCGPLNGVSLAASNWPGQLGDTQGTPRGGLYGITLAHAGKFTAGAPVNHEGRLAVKLTHDMEADLVAIGAAYQVQVVNRISPNRS